MSTNAILTDTEAVLTTSTSTTLGYNSGQTVPPRWLFCNNASPITVTLPKIGITQPTSTGGNYLPSLNGFAITIYSVGAGTVTVSAASGDSLVGTATVATNASRTYTSLPAATNATGSWYMTATNS